MNSAKKTALWLIKTSCYLSIIAFAVIYICSFMWLKMGMGYTRSMFNHAVMEANANLTQPNVRIGDLIIAKEYLYSRTPDIHDVIVYPYNDEIHISIVEKVNEEEDNVFSFRVTPYGEESSILLHKEDIIGELYIVAEGLGKIGMFLISPMFVVLLYSIVGFIIISIKSINKPRKNNQEKVKINSDIVENTKVSQGSKEENKSSLNEDKSLVAYLNESDSKPLEEKEPTTANISQDTSIKEKDSTVITVNSKTKRKKKRVSLSKKKPKKKPNKKHFNKYNRKKKIKKSKIRKNKCNHKKNVKNR